MEIELSNALEEGARITYGYRWICKSSDYYTTYERRPRQQYTRVKYKGLEIDKAIKILMEDD